MLWQLPANFHRDEDRLADALAHLPPGRHCFEFRHRAGSPSRSCELLRAYGAALVYGDHPERPWQPLESDHRLDLPALPLRPPRPPRQLLRDRAARVGGAAARAARERAEVFAYFNNDWEAFAPRNAERLRKLVEGVEHAANAW